MLLNGKKTERMLMRFSEEMSLQIRALAELEHRSIQDQIRFLIASGLSQAWSRSGNGTMSTERQQTSTVSCAPAPAPPMSTGVNSGKYSSRKTA
jgi:hypothetical protein